MKLLACRGDKLMAIAVQEAVRLAKEMVGAEGFEPPTYAL